jgi:hypothetical protein
MVRHEGCDLVAIVAGDAVSSLPTKEFLRRADLGCASPDNEIPSPVIPNSYDKIAQWQMKTYGGAHRHLLMQWNALGITFDYLCCCCCQSLGNSLP